MTCLFAFQKYSTDQKTIHEEEGEKRKVNSSAIMMDLKFKN
jgi:hypothetical protein